MEVARIHLTVLETRCWEVEVAQTRVWRQIQVLPQTVVVVEGSLLYLAFLLEEFLKMVVGTLAQQQGALAVAVGSWGAQQESGTSPEII